MTLFVAASLLSPNFGLMIFFSIFFGILLWILKRYAWGPISEALDAREQSIVDSLNRAEKALEESRQLQAKNEEARRDAERESQRVLLHAREEAQRIREDEVQRTRLEIQEMRATAREEIERQKGAALRELRTEVASLAIQAAEQILHENLDRTRQQRLVDRFISELSKN